MALRNQPISVFRKSGGYVPGQGADAGWQRCESELGGEAVGVFFCEWIGTYGSHLIEAQAQGVEESATVRMRYNPDVYAALRDSECVVVKGGGEAAGVIVGGKPDRSRADLWSLWGGVDNVREESREMEFKVRRYEPK